MIDIVEEILARPNRPKTLAGIRRQMFIERHKVDLEVAEGFSKMRAWR
jgi:hypothetical protein